MRELAPHLPPDSELVLSLALDPAENAARRGENSTHITLRPQFATGSADLLPADEAARSRPWP